MVDIISINNLSEDNGIYFAKTTKKVHYPDEGHNECLQIEDESFWFKHRNNIIFELIKKHPSENLILDVGGGNDYVTKAIQEIGIECYFIEPDIQGAINAKKEV